MTKAIALLSGGLDSILATKLILQQGIAVEAINFLTVFCTCSRGEESCLSSKSAAEKLGISLRVFEVSNEYFEIIKNPKYGYGANMNPCLDCRIFMFKKAGQYMRESGAQFLITGEVLGERPMSQRKEAMRIIERDSGLEGLILRPLCARLLEPTIPEKEGLVNREKLLSISGRSRKSQIELAAQLGINDYPCPAGGCLLTDPGFSRRMKDLMKYHPDFGLNDVQLLKVGRHFRLSSQTKLIVGRNEEENTKLLNLSKDKDICLQPVEIKGPVGVLRGLVDDNILSLASSIIARYSDNNQGEVKISYSKAPNNISNPIILVGSIKDELLKSYRI